ncbi:MAG: monooxygenase [Aeromicrobium sp.]|jgi:monooxygenase|nr:monooxygenase [Aeromicrobium sp.]
MTDPEHLDVLIVGAGLSGVAAAVYLQKLSPGRSFAILEGRDNLGGTWDLFRYPGIRSDSDMFTLGYGFKPWTRERSIAAGASIREYIGETVDDHDLRSHVRLGHQVVRADWSSETDLWTVTVRHGGDDLVLTCRFLLMCSGYYSYKRGYTPALPGIETFRGQVVHPQTWPEDLDHAGKKVVVIGSGATAVTLVPSLAATADKVTMLQRSPGYMAVDGDVDHFAAKLRRVVGARLAYKFIRLRNTRRQQATYKKAKGDPETFKQGLFDVIREKVGQEALDQHFTPSYQPWDQRLCLVPNGDMFTAIAEGRADVATGQIETFTETGIRLTTGQEIEADIVVTATGLELVSPGEAEFRVDGEIVDFATRWTYKGLGYSGVPNLAFFFGYINTSWTVRIELVAAYVCKVLNHMARTGATKVTPTLRPEDAHMPQLPFIADISSGYFLRANGVLPKQGDHAPWTNPQNHSETKKMLTAPVEDGVLVFEGASRDARTRSATSAR